MEAARDEIAGAISEVRAVARAENDESRQMAADYLDAQFAGITDARALREAAANAQALYGGAGSFSDVGSAESARAVGNLWHALQSGRWFVRKSSTRWIWGLLGTLIFAPLLAWFVTASVNESAKIDKMVAIADGIPAAGWKVTNKHDPSRAIGCIPFDQPCYSLFRYWEAPEPVDLDEIVESTGYAVKPSYIEGCVDGNVDGYRAGWQDRVRFQLCVDGNEIDLSMTAR